jgi:protein SCO1
VSSRTIAAVAAVMLSVGLVAGCGGSSGDQAAGSHAGHDATTTAATAPAAFEGGVINPRRAAPPLRLKDINGKTVDIKDYRGEPVLVTFVYAHCPDVCPLIMENLRRVRADAGPLGKKMKVIAVSVDPKGDTVPVVRAFLKTHRVNGLVDYLIGTQAQLEPVWANWQIARGVPKTNPELVEHSGLIYGVTGSGELATAYPVGFKPDAIVRDLPLLAQS